MKKINSSFIGIMVALTSVVLVSCSDDFSNTVGAPQKKENTETTTPTQPEKKDSTTWTNYAGTTHKVYPESYVITKMYGLNKKGEKDSLLNRYDFVRSLKSDTTIYLKEAPEGNLSYSVSPDDTWLGEFSINAQADSCATIYSKKNYNLSNGVTLTLNTERMTYYHMIDGKAWKYSEPQQKFGSMTINPTIGEFIRNDSIFGTRDNVCKTYTKLGTETFVDSCVVREVWFKSVVEKPEPSYNIYVNEPVSHLASSMVQISKNNWRNVHLMVGKENLHAVVCTTDSHNDKVVSVEDKAVALSRVIVNDKVNSVIYDETTGLYVSSLIAPDNEGWSWEGFIDGREIVNDLGNQQAIEEGIKNFMESDTSKPTPFFSGVSAKVTSTWHEYSYTTITWVKYSKDGKACTNVIVVKSPKKA